MLRARLIERTVGLEGASLLHRLARSLAAGLAVIAPEETHHPQETPQLMKETGVAPLVLRGPSPALVVNVLVSLRALSMRRIIAHESHLQRMNRFHPPLKWAAESWSFFLAQVTPPHPRPPSHPPKWPLLSLQPNPTRSERPSTYSLCISRVISQRCFQARRCHSAREGSGGED